MKGDMQLKRGALGWNSLYSCLSLKPLGLCKGRCPCVSDDPKFVYPAHGIIVQTSMDRVDSLTSPRRACPYCPTFFTDLR